MAVITWPVFICMNQMVECMTCCEAELNKKVKCRTRCFLLTLTIQMFLLKVLVTVGASSLAIVALLCVILVAFNTLLCTVGTKRHDSIGLGESAGQAVLLIYCLNGILTYLTVNWHPRTAIINARSNRIITWAISKWSPEADLFSGTTLINIWLPQISTPF